MLLICIFIEFVNVIIVYQNKIGTSGRKEGRMEVRKEGKKEEWMEGRKNG